MVVDIEQSLHNQVAHEDQRDAACVKLAEVHLFSPGRVLMHWVRGGGDVGAGAGLRARTAMAESSAVPSMNQVLGFDDRCEGGEWMEDLEASRNVAMAPPGCGKQGGGKAPNLHTVAQDDAQYTSTAKPGTPSCAPTISRAPRTPSSLTHLSGPKEVEEMI